MSGVLPDDVPDEFLGPSPQAEWARDAAGVMPASGDLPDTVHADPAVAVPSWRPARRGDTPGQLAPELHGDQPEGQQPRVCDALCRDVEEDRDRLAAQVEQMREDRLKLTATIAAFPDVHNAANLAHARMERDALRGELATMREVALGNKRHVAYLTEENERLRAEVARVRAGVAEDLRPLIKALTAVYDTYLSTGGYEPTPEQIKAGMASLVPIEDSHAMEAACDAVLPAAPAESAVDAAFVARKREFSARTFGPQSLAGVIDHIRKELVEVEADPTDLGEWVDVILLGLDGAWRAGHQPQEIIDAIVAKQARCEARTWPDWRTTDPGKAIEHDRTAAPAESVVGTPPDPAGRCTKCGGSLGACATCGTPAQCGEVFCVRHADSPDWAAPVGPLPEDEGTRQEAPRGQR